MPEIKSTLDLIMEKTKNLSMTQEERKAIRLKELQAKVKGWVQRYLDGLTDTEAMQTFLAETQEEHAIAIDLFRKTALAHIEPEGNNERVFRLLEEVLDEETEPLVQRIASFKSEIEQEKARHAQEALRALDKKGISGSAVTPNIHQYPPWQAWYTAAQDSFRQGLVTESRSEKNPAPGRLKGRAK